METLRIQNCNSWLISHDDDLKHKLWVALRFRDKGYFHSLAYKKKKWDGFVNFFSKKSGKFATGLLPDIQVALKKLKIPYNIIDQRDPLKWRVKYINDQFLNPWCPPDFNLEEMRDYQPDFVNKVLKHNRGIVKGPTGCHRKGQKVLMYDGALKKVENIKIGDLLMGDNSEPRKVLNLCRGHGKMCKIIPNKGKEFVVNEDHILTLVKVCSHKNRCPGELGGEVIDVKVKDWLKWSKWKKHTHKLFRVKVNFINKKNKFTMDPYFLGIMLGDGSLNRSPSVTTMDQEIIEEVYKQANEHKIKIREVEQENNKSKVYFFTTKSKKIKRNIIIENLKDISLWKTKCKNKYIPLEYKTSSKKDRLKILAGLLDTDGSLNEIKSGYDFISKSKQLSEDVCFVAKSLGFSCSGVAECYKEDQNGNGGIYFRIYIGGDGLHKIPCKIKRKIAKNKKKRVNYLRTGFKVEKLEKENYYGFTLDGNQRYLLDDFTVTHNSGKTLILISTLKCLPPKTPTLFLTKVTKAASLVHQNYEEMELWGVENLGRFYDKYKEPNYTICCTTNARSLEKIEKLMPKFKVLIVDEVHECMTPSVIKMYKKMKSAVVRIGLSATPFKDKKVEKYKVKSYFGPIFKTDTTEDGHLKTVDLQDRGILSPSRCFFHPIDSPSLPYEPYIDAVTLGIAESDEFHEIVRRLARTLNGRTLIMVERKEQGKRLQEIIIGSNWISGVDSLKVRKAVFKKLTTSSETIAIAMRQIVTAGINLKVHNIINAAGGDAAHNITQQIGRGLRCADDKDMLNFHDFNFKNNPYLKKHSKHRIKTLREEGHEVIIKESIDF